MAKARSKTATAVTVHSRALAHGHDAAGAADLRPGFAFNDADDLWFALGWPHFELLTDEIVVDPAEAVVDVYRKKQFDRRVWSAHVAALLARVMCAPSGTMFDPGRGTVGPNDLGRALLQGSSSIASEEVSGLIHQAMAQPSMTPGVLRKILGLLEAHVGPECVLSALIEVVEAWPSRRWRANDHVSHRTALLVAPLLLRIHRVDGEPLRQRLQRILGEVAPDIAKRSDDDLNAYRALDIALHGRDGAERSAQRWADREELAWVRGAPELVMERLREMEGPGESVVDVRLAFVGGVEELELERRWWREYTEPTTLDAQRTFVATYGRVRSPTVVEIMTEMAESSRVKKLASDWLATHADYASAG